MLPRLRSFIAKSQPLVLCTATSRAASSISSEAEHKLQHLGQCELTKTQVSSKRTEL